MCILFISSSLFLFADVTDLIDQPLDNVKAFSKLTLAIFGDNTCTNDHIVAYVYYRIWYTGDRTQGINLALMTYTYKAITVIKRAYSYL